MQKQLYQKRDNYADAYDYLKGRFLVQGDLGHIEHIVSCSAWWDSNKPNISPATLSFRGKFPD